MAASQREIAERLKVSRSLVAQVLGNTPGARFSEDTRRRVLRTASELGYHPNTAARSLSTGKSYAVTFAHLRSKFSTNRDAYNAAIEGCADELSKHGYELKIKIFGELDELLEGLRETHSRHSSDAFILWGNEDDVEKQGTLLDELGCAFVAKGRHELSHPEWPQADFDHEGMMGLAVRHLAALGHRQIAYLGYDAPGSAYVQKLRMGFEQSVIESVGAAPDPRFVLQVVTGPSTAQAAMQEWMKLPAHDRPTALVIGAADQAWEGIELALGMAGQVIGDGPGQFSVAGMGSHDLTTMFGQGHYFPATDLTDLGREMVRVLLAPILHRQEPTNRIVRLMPKLKPTRMLRLLDYVSFDHRAAPQ